MFYNVMEITQQLYQTQKVKLNFNLPLNVDSRTRKFFYAGGTYFQLLANSQKCHFD